MKKILVLISVLMSSCYLSQYSSLEGNWEYLGEDNKKEFITFIDESFSWERYSYDINGETIIDKVSGTYKCFIEKRKVTIGEDIKTEYSPYVDLTYIQNDKEITQSFNFYISESGNSLSLYREQLSQFIRGEE